MQMFIIIGMPRSGSTFLQTTIAQHPGVKVYTELFHPLTVERQTSHVICENNERVFFDSDKDDAIDFLSKHVWNDINHQYGAVGFKLFAERVQCIGTDKLFLKLKQNFPNLKFIHIERSNFLDCWISREIAIRTGQWVQFETSDKSSFSSKIYASPFKLEQFFNNYSEANNFFKSNFFSGDNYLHVDYDYFCNNFEKNSQEIFNFLGLNTIKVVAKTQKQNISKSLEQIQNIDEVRTFFMSGRYAHFFGYSRQDANISADYQSLHRIAKTISVEEWITVVEKSTEQQQSILLANIPLPSAPPANKQAIFHGNSGKAAIKSAAPVYKYVLNICQRYQITPIETLLDFGCGWGRFTRLFVRDVEATGLFGIDPWTEAIQMCRQHMPYASFIQSALEPPLIFQDNFFQVVFANSVFSHLSEASALAWIQEIGRILRPGGLLIATTHPRNFLIVVQEIKQGIRKVESDWHQLLEKSAIDIDQALCELDQGQFIHIVTGQNNGLYGDSCVPKAYIERVWGEHLELLEFIDDQTQFPQATFVLRKRFN